MDQKVALITGASSGMGLETAYCLLNAGYIVYGAARRVERMHPLKEKGGRILPLDVTNEESMVACVDQILKETGRIDLLVNNAGYGSYGSIESLPLEEARRQFEVNLFGLARMTQLVLPAMRKQNSGKIVNIASMGGRFSSPFGAWYHSTKYAVESFSDCLRMETKPFHIDVIIIEPGMIRTEWAQITASNLRKVSSHDAYKENALKTAEYYDTMYKKDAISSPQLVARTIAKAVQAKRPKTRYLVGYGAKPFVFMRKITSDRLFERIMCKTMGLSQ